MVSVGLEVYSKNKKHPEGCFAFIVPRAGLEPARYCYQGILSPSCLPFHHQGIWEAQAGVEPANISFANCRVGPLRHCAIRPI